jgi:hypothetical protein
MRKSKRVCICERPTAAEEQFGRFSIVAIVGLSAVIIMSPLLERVAAGTAFLLALLAGAQAQKMDLDWRTFAVPGFGTSVEYPAAIFAPAGKPAVGTGQRFEREDGGAVLSVYSRPNDAGETPATYLRHNLRMKRSGLDYARISGSFFAISAERNGVILYSRCNFSGGGGGALHCFDLKYPQAEKRSWDAVVTRISLSLRPLRG